MTERPVDDIAEAAAAVWDARLRGAKATDRDREEFGRWLAAAPRNSAAHERLQQALVAVRENVMVPELSALRDEARRGIASYRRRRKMLGSMAALAATLLLVVGLGLTTERGADLAVAMRGGTVYRTGMDERTRVTLADGSAVTLDAGTRLWVQFKRTRRDVTLVAGRALFHVAKNAQRPFIVRARDETITALGTVFDVSLSSSRLRVTLAEGSVAVRPIDGIRTALREHILKPHQQLVHTTGRSTTELHTVDPVKELSWTEGRVFFDNETLAAAAEEMNRYARAEIVVDPAVAAMRINGMFRTSNQIGFVAALQTTLPVEAHNDDRGRIVVSRRLD